MDSFAEFFVFYKPKKTIKNSSGQIWQLYAYVANESSLKAIQFSALFIYLFIYLFYYYYYFLIFSDQFLSLLHLQRQIYGCY